MMAMMPVPMTFVVMTMMTVMSMVSVTVPFRLCLSRRVGLLMMMIVMPVRYMGLRVVVVMMMMLFLRFVVMMVDRDHFGVVVVVDELRHVYVHVVTEKQEVLFGTINLTNSKCS